MPRVCIVKGCPSINKESEKQTHHKFPTSDPGRLRKWLEKLDLRHELSPTSVLCGLHFDDSDFIEVAGVKRLQHNSIPLEFKADGRKLLSGTSQSEATNEASAEASKPIKVFEDFIEGTSSNSNAPWRANWNIYKQPDGVCFYRLTCDEHFTNVTMSFKILINKDLQVVVFSRDLEAEAFELNWILNNSKLEHWNQFYNLLDHYQHEPDVKLKSNPHFHIKQAHDALQRIKSSPMVQQLIDPITLQLSLAGESFDPFTGDCCITDETAVKQEAEEMNFPVERDLLLDGRSDADMLEVEEVKVEKQEPLESSVYVTINETEWIGAAKMKKKTGPKRKERDGSEVLPCEFCGRLFKTKHQLRSHFYYTHDGPVRCDICGKQLKVKKSLRTHMVQHMANQYVNCPQCGDSLRSYNLRRHIRVRHEGYKPFACSICGKLSSNRTTWRQHELTHMDKETRMLKETNEHRSKTASRSVESHQPAPSLFAFARPPGLITYEKRASASKARKTSKSKQLCPKCGQVFFQGGNVLFDHVSRCNGTPAEKRRGYNYPCVHCERKFNAKTKCARHMLEVHQRHIENIEKFCFQCNREVEEPFAHAKSHNCPFKCQECGTRFFSQEKLEVHMKKHKSDEARPFNCDSCSASFKTKNHRTSHFTLVHKKDEESQFACSICDKRFVFQYLLTGHMIVHSNLRKYGCSFCNLKFKTIQRMKEHCRRDHGEENAYPCQSCDVKLKTLNDLKSHLQDEHGVSMNVQKYHDGKSAIMEIC